MEWGAIILKAALPVQHVNHPLGVAVAKVGVVWRSIVDHVLVNGVLGLVGEDTRGQAGDDLDHIRFVAHQQDVVVHHQVVALRGGRS